MSGAAIALAIVAGGAPSAAEPAPLQISIEDAMAAAVRASLPLAAARATRERAGSDVTAARSGYFPQISVSGSYVDTLRSEYEGLFDAPQGSAPSGMGSMVGDLSGLIPHRRSAGGPRRSPSAHHRDAVAAEGDRR